LRRRICGLGERVCHNNISGVTLQLVDVMTVKYAIHT
jgi:hypothetical protein